MQTTVLNYRIIIEPETDEKGKTVYTAVCPKLGVADWGKTVEQAIDHMRDALSCYIESLTKHGQSIPPGDTDAFMVTTTQVPVPHNATVAYA